jgi:DNA (cytosine-5)-methyltransferase 1
MNYYNEFDPYAAQWLRNLIDAGHLPKGEVDSRSIKDVKASELTGYTQCHFFAGLGGWSHALRLARWPENRPVWTGSCPCQPFSAAGKGGALLTNVTSGLSGSTSSASADLTLSLVSRLKQRLTTDGSTLFKSDLEGEGYACGAVGIPAGGVGAPHIRQRLYFVANTFGSNEQQWSKNVGKTQFTGGSSIDSELADNIDAGSQGRVRGGAHERRPDQHGHAGRDGATGFWANCDWLPCRDGKARPVEPGTFPLAHGVSGRVGRLRAYGNAIVPQVAQTFIEAYLES